MHSPKDYQEIYANGQRVVAKNFIFFVQNSIENKWKIGIAVSKKIGKAWMRNRIKRVIREIFRLEQQNLPDGIKIITVVKRGCGKNVVFSDVVRQDVKFLMSRL